MEEIAYGVFVQRRDQGVPKLCKLLDDRLFLSLESAEVAARAIAVEYSCKVEVRELRVEVRSSRLVTDSPL